MKPFIHHSAAPIRWARRIHWTLAIAAYVAVIAYNFYLGTQPH